MTTCYHCDVRLREVETERTGSRRTFCKCPRCDASYVVIPAVDAVSVDRLVELFGKERHDATAA